MTTQKINYILMSVLLAVALLAGYFGITLPVQPEIPEPLPPADLAPLESQVAAVAQRVDDLERDAPAVDLGDLSFSTRYNTPCYQAQGGANWVAGDGCTWTIGDGATLELITGSTVSLINLITSTLDGLTVNGNTVITGTTSVGGVLTATGGVVGNVTGNVTGNITGNVTGNVTGAISATAPLTVGGYAFTYTAPLTLTGVLTNVRLLYYQTP